VETKRRAIEPNIGLFEEDQQTAASMVLKNRVNFSIWHLFRMAFAMKKNEAANPGDVTFLRPRCVFLHPQHILNLIEKFRLLLCHLTHSQRRWAENPDTTCFVSLRFQAYTDP